MNAELIVLHEEALRMTHPVFGVAPVGTKVVYVWDDDYFRQATYSLKRLVFIYETLCELSVDILQGNTLKTIQELAPSMLYIPATNKPLIVSIIDTLKSVAPVEIVADEVFAVIKKPTDFRRFFQYWNKAEKSAFQPDAGTHA